MKEIIRQEKFFILERESPDSHAKSTESALSDSAFLDDISVERRVNMKQ
ncbi:MAG: hypothetical protein OXM61_10920 [Candidatus Poribacteria bacterium]|nr:hypothetical protein [Candidatus Poribacteria bacterium]